MSEDSFKVGTPLFNIGFSNKEHILEVEEGKNYLIRTWSWKRFRFIHKIITVKDGELIVKVAKKFENN